MDYFNDERYWDIKLLNKWFAISSILFLISIIWMFIDDNDDEYKDYQIKYTELKQKLALEKERVELELVKDKRKYFELKKEEAQTKLDGKKTILDSLNNQLTNYKGQVYKANMEYLGKKAKLDELKYLYEYETI